ncbi:MAG TPA: ribosome small subunit-dependent GTPase A [Candidatus Krumholzibacterium sp.]|nr:ribosome small subunit-dependent GTPase A [Candidatus Krumholzibacterium sp.]
MNSPSNSTGFVVRIKGSEYHVMDGATEVVCSVRGKFRIEREPGDGMPVVGDNVVYRREQARDTRGPTGLIVSIEPRTSVFARAGAHEKRKYRVLGANLDRVFLVHAVKNPRLNTRLMDRMLVAAESSSIEPVICINKIDLEKDHRSLEEALRLYPEMGYRLVFCSAVDGTGVEELRELMTASRSIMAGPSGAGKTSLLAALEPGLDIRISSVSEKTGKGRHTTTHFELHPLACGGYLGDTPGIREFGIKGITKKDLGGCFREMRGFLGHCRFATCTHSHEPECAVKEAVGEGIISEERYESYLRILEDLPVWGEGE